MKKRIFPLGFSAVLLTVAVAAVAQNPMAAADILARGWDHPTILATGMESFFRENFPMKEELRGLAITLKVAGGGQEQNGLFLAENGLIPSFKATSDSTFHRNNTRQLLNFAEKNSAQVYVMLLPTASAIYQDKLPSYAPQYNQKSYIENTYKQFYGKATTVDAYYPLLYSDYDYLYYRTQDDLAPLGGYTVYAAMGQRLGFSAIPLQQFETSYACHDYYGNLYDQWGYGGIRPDVITTYRYIGESPAFRVDHWERFTQRTYYTLYPQEATVGGKSLNVILGGHSPRIEIRAEGARENSLLVVGDHTAMSYLPFLAHHYGHITYVDLSLLTAGEIGKLEPEGYNQVLFAYSLETYLNTDQPARAALFTPKEG